MKFVESFGRHMIEAFLEEDGLNFLRDRDGDFIVQFGYDDEIEGHPRFLLAVAGEDNEQYCLRGDTLSRIPREDWDRSTRLCNEWNALYKMPKVYFEVDDPNKSTTGRIVCEQWLDLEAGVHQELINQFTSTFFSACFGFWRWLERQHAISALADDKDDDAEADPESESENLALEDQREPDTDPDEENSEEDRIEDV